MIHVEKKNDTLFTFEELGVGDFFEYDEVLFFKTDNNYKVETNAFCFNTSRFTCFNAYEEVRKIENLTITY